MLTIAICTHDRASDVQCCLEHLHPQIDFGVAQLVLVDSGSGPADARLLAGMVEAFPGVRLIRLEEAGLSRARNAAVQVAKDGWVAFLDDDAIPDRQWFTQALRLIAEAPGDCAIIGGDVAPVFPAGATPKLGRRWRQLLSLVEQPEECFDAAGASICGANSIYRRRCLVDVGGFPETLGRIGTNLLSGEEKLVRDVAVRSGWTVGRSHRLRVGHRIAAARLERGWAARRAYWDGLSDERIRAIMGQRTAQMDGAELLARLAALGVLYPFSPVRQEFFIRFWYTLGRLREWHRNAWAQRTEAGPAASMTVPRIP